ncbi:MAG TPA: hypothetical protein PLQ71_02930 [Nitrospira sp.]|nr:hypothetical protein [Nitrospira sp.]
MAKIIDRQGGEQQVKLEASIYQEAADKNCSVKQLLALKYPTDEAKYGSTFNQLLAGCGVYAKDAPELGIRKTTVADIMEGTFEVNAGVITRDATPTSRILFPAIVLEAIEDRLKTDATGDLAIFNRMIAMNDNINGPKYEQPLINLTRPGAARSQPISQLSEPAVMMHMTVSDSAKTIPSFALGLVVAEEAKRAWTLDFVSMSLVRQAEQERAALMDQYISNILNGDVDWGMTALTAVKANTFDSSIVTNGVLTHKAFVKWLRNKRRQRSIDWLIMDVDTYLAVVGRSGRPTVNDAGDGSLERMQIVVDPQNPGITNPNVFLVDSGVIPANTIIGLDSRYALRRVRNIQADYKAAEQLVMRRGEQMRWDWSELVLRVYDEAFDVLSLTI